MKKRITILMITLLLTIPVCVGCGAESTTTEPTETATATTTEESTTEQAEEATATSERTAEPTPEVKEEPSEEATAETEPETTEPTETVEQEPKEEATLESEQQATYTYTDMSAIMYAQQTVNVRDLPDTNGNKVGSLSTNDEIAISGQCNETGWYRFEYNGNVAYVSNKYVGENKVEVQASSSKSSKNKIENEDSYVPGQIINKGGTNVYFVMGPNVNFDELCRQCDAIVSENLGVELMYTGGGGYYWFNDGGFINGEWVSYPNANGSPGIFFPTYTRIDGKWLGDPADAIFNSVK